MATSEEMARRIRVAASASSAAVLQATATAATLTGALAAAEPRLAELAHRSLDDLHRLLAKAADAGAARSFEVHVDIRPEPDPGLLAMRLQEALDSLYEIIPETGDGPDAEALEHLVEHTLMNLRELQELARRLEGTVG